jgi:hypothetical protein
VSLDNQPIYAGGCQCGAVRFRIEGALGEASVCHCRMCQKASGNFYMPLVSARDARVTWTRGEPKRFRSSNYAQRGFCDACGTPLTYEAPDGLAIAIGAFDHPEEVAPVVQWGIEARLPYVDGVAGLPAHRTLDDAEAANFIAKIVSCQHPDHETENWPVQDR